MRYERERDVRIPELVEKIHNFLGEACCVSIKVISTLLGVGATTVQRTGAKCVQSLFPWCSLVSILEERVPVRAYLC